MYSAWFLYLLSVFTPNGNLHRACLFIIAILAPAENEWINNCAAVHCSSLFSFLSLRQNPFNSLSKYHGLWYALSVAYVVSSAWEAHQPVPTCYHLFTIEGTSMSSLQWWIPSASLFCFIIHVVVSQPVNRDPFEFWNHIRLIFLPPEPGPVSGTQEALSKCLLDWIKSVSCGFCSCCPSLDC